VERKADCILLSIDSYRTETTGDKKCSTTELAGGHGIMTFNNICAKSGVNCTPFHTVKSCRCLRTLGLFNNVFSGLGYVAVNVRTITMNGKGYGRLHKHGPISNTILTFALVG
jgi:hypothetical protein